VKGRISIDPERGGTAYDEMIFGQFLEHFHRQVYGGVFDPGSPLADARGFRRDVIEALRELRVPIVRWPGGCFVSAYHWKHGVGPRREPVYDKAWNVEEPNTFGTDEFVAWCRAVGAEPYLCTNAGTGTEEEMSDWVEYCNGRLGTWARLRERHGHPEPHGVRFWSIGNENWGSHEIGAKKASAWAPFVAEAAKMMLRADPSIRLLAAALPDVDWTLPLLREAGRSLSYVSIHGYWDPLWRENRISEYATCMMRSTNPEELIRTTESILRIAGLEDRVAIAFDEWNLRGWHHPDLGSAAFRDIAARDKNDIAATYTMADAVFSACFLNACLRHAPSVRMACMAPVVNARGPLYVHPGGVVRRTTFHVLRMYRDLLPPRVLDCWSESDAFSHGTDSVPCLDAVATGGGQDGSIALAIVNRHPDQDVICSVRIGGTRVHGELDAVVLSGDGPDAFNDVDRPDRVTPERRTLAFRAGEVAIPPHTVAIVKVP
jgi:alpha-L-arabinofuranosidase